MVRTFYCCFKNCPSRSSNKPENKTNVTFHELPSTEHMRAEWLKVIGNDDQWVPKDRTAVCSLHFKSTDFIQSKKRAVLKVGSIPVRDVTAVQSEESVKRCYGAQSEATSVPRTEETASSTPPKTLQRSLPGDEAMDSESDSEIYKIEEIKKKRIRNGIVEYLLKWEGFPESENSWERAENMRCPDTVREFEENLKQQERKELGLLTSFEKGMTVEKIFGATQEKEETYFFVKWAGMDKASFESNADMKKHFPQAVIKFYEDRLIFKKEHVDLKI